MDPVVGNKVKALVKGVEVEALIINRMEMRLRLEYDGKSCWAEVQNVMEIISSSGDGGGSDAPTAASLPPAAAAAAAPSPTTGIGRRLSANMAAKLAQFGGSSGGGVTKPVGALAAKPATAATPSPKAAPPAVASPAAESAGAKAPADGNEQEAERSEKEAKGGSSSSSSSSGCMAILEAQQAPNGLTDQKIFFSFCQILIDETPIALRELFRHLWNKRNPREVQWDNTAKTGERFAHGFDSDYTESLGTGTIREGSNRVSGLSQRPKKRSRVKLVGAGLQTKLLTVTTTSEEFDAGEGSATRYSATLGEKFMEGGAGEKSHNVEVFKSKISEINFSDKSAVNNSASREKIENGDIEMWDLTLLLWALLNSEHKLCESEEDGQMPALRLTLDSGQGVRKVRNGAFGHINKATMTWDKFVSHVRRLLGAVEAIDAIIGGGCRSRLEAKIIEALANWDEGMLEKYMNDLRRWEDLQKSLDKIDEKVGEIKEEVVTGFEYMREGFEYVGDQLGGLRIAQTRKEQYPKLFYFLSDPTLDFGLLEEEQSELCDAMTKFGMSDIQDLIHFTPEQFGEFQRSLDTCSLSGVSLLATIFHFPLACVISSSFITL